jgi:hypothetical protein
MPLSIAGFWLSFINVDPNSGFPNDGGFHLNLPNPATGAFNGIHARLTQTPINNGVYTPATSKSIDHITFEEPEPFTTNKFVYDGDLIEESPGHLITVNGKRYRVPLPTPTEKIKAAALDDDDWVGTHTT